MTASADDHLPSGTILAESYALVRPLARGGMGTVYEATHLRLAGRRVAIKVLRADATLSRREVASRFRREAEICSTLKHPHIVTVTDWGTLADERPFFVMELLEGLPLDRRMGQGRLDQAQIYRILDQAGAALQHAHDQGIVHRDVKPSNIFLESIGAVAADAWQVKVLDFGISKVLTANTLETTEVKLIGSPRYMSPEQARGKNEEITPSADQWGLATVAYELLAGQPAFTGDTLSSMLFNIVYEQPPPLGELAPHLPPAVVAAVARAMAKDPADRFPAVVDFVAALGELQHEPTDRLADTMASRGRRPLRRRPWRAWLPALGLSVLGGLAAAGILVRFRDAPPPSPPPSVEVSPRSEPASSPPAAEPEVEPPPALASAPSRPSPPASPDPPVPPAVEGLLAEAEAALADGEWAEAIRLATRSIGQLDTPRARRTIALAYCGRGDLELSRAALHRVRAGDRPAVVRRCRELGLAW